ETVRITCPPIDRGKAIPLRAQTWEYRLNLGKEICSVFLRGARGKNIGSLAAGVVNKNARGAGLRARDFPSRLIAAIGISLPIAVEWTPRARVELQVELRIRTHREFLDRDDFKLTEPGLCQID